jgi:glycerol-3-phosphate dehydrogenase
MNLTSTEIYDLGIIGGGISGAAIARDASLRGMHVVLFEKNEFGSGASGKSSKLIHGGIRYLELAWNALKRADFEESWKNFRFVFVSLRESRILRRIAPTLVEPLPMVIPIYQADARKPWMIYAGTLLYFLLAFFAGGAKFPTIYGNKKSILEAIPELNPEGLLGGVKIWDHWVDDKALVLATMASAKKSGAHCFEKTVVTEYQHDEASNNFLIRVSNPKEERIVHVRKLVNASGPWLDKTRFLGHEKNGDLILPVAGSHITFPAFLPCSTLLQAKDGRFFFVINHAGTARVGTTERVVTNLDSVKPTEGEIDYLLSSLERYFSKTDLTKHRILSQDAGVRPLSALSSHGNPNEISREHEIRVSRSGCVHMIGVKLTDHRRAAEEVVNRLIPLLLPTNPTLRQKTLTRRLPIIEN